MARPASATRPAPALNTSATSGCLLPIPRRDPTSDARGTGVRIKADCRDSAVSARRNRAGKLTII